MKNKGFTLIELIVVIGILTLITGIVLANYNKFGGKILLRNLTYDLALTVREAQVYGISGRFQESDTFNKAPIVIYFDTTQGAQYSFYMFRDANGNSEQDGGEFISGYNLGQGFAISSIEANGGAVTGINKLAIAFVRPEPDAVIQDRASGREGTVYPDARIIIESPKGDKLSVFVESAGQISVQRVIP